MPKLGWEEDGVEFEDIFNILKNTQFPCSRINLLYLGHDALSGKPTSPAAGRKIVGQSPCRAKQETKDLQFLLGSAFTQTIVFFSN